MVKSPLLRRTHTHISNYKLTKGRDLWNKAVFDKTFLCEVELCDIDLFQKDWFEIDDLQID